MTDTKQVVINECFGGFGLSPEATLRLYELGCESIATPVDEYYRREDDGGPFSKSGSLEKWRAYLANPESRQGIFLTVFSPDESHILYASGIDRTDALLLQVVSEMGDAANGQCAKLEVVEIPADVDWEIDEYDGNEHIAEKHRTWR